MEKIKKNKIFVQIASYRDPELIPTIKDCIEKAKFPQNLVFSIAWQHSPDDKWDDLSEYLNDSRFKILDISHLKSEGVCWARNKLQLQYDNEEYTLQLDSHHRFAENWDTELIKVYKKLKKAGYKKPLITGYIPSYEPTNDPKGRVIEPWVMNFDRFSPEGVIHTMPATIDDYKERDLPIPARFYSAHFAFASGKFVKEVPHDPNLYFHGEEHSISARAYTWGYDLFHPVKTVVWHEYTRRDKKKQWDDVTSWPTKNEGAFVRVRQLFYMEPRTQDFGPYDFGPVRTLEEYEKYAGISFQRRAVQQYTLDKKLPPNPPLSEEEYEKSFVKWFKHCIDVGYDRVPEKDYDFWAVAFHRENTSTDPNEDTTLYRKDADKNEIDSFFRDPDHYCKIWREFETSIPPKYWVVWPHSISKGWCERITGDLY
jgi:hypothetical protein